MAPPPASDGYTNGNAPLECVAPSSLKVLKVPAPAPAPAPAPPPIAMQGGSGDTSYVKNSWQQRHIVSEVEAELWEAVRGLPRAPSLAPGEWALRVADLGCATGSNTVSAVDKTVRNVRALLEARGAEVPPQVHAFFNDLPHNDFNTLFRGFAPYAGPPADAVDAVAVGTGDCRNYFVAGVPGSFHGSLFPTASLHACTCFIALHFLTQVPKEVTDRSSPAFNKGRVWHDGSSLATRQAFSRQHVKDLTAFLNARAEELVPGGIVIAILVGLDLEEGKRSPLTKVMDESMQQLVQEGVLDEEAVDMFNIPARSGSMDELKCAIKACGAFQTHLLQKRVVHFYTEEARAALQADAKLCAKVYTDTARTVSCPLFQAIFGARATELLFQRHAQLVERDHLEVLDAFHTTLHLVVLYRNP